MGVHWKIGFWREGGYEKQIHRGKLLKKGGLLNLQILGGGRGDFEGVHIPMYTMHIC